MATQLCEALVGVSHHNGEVDPSDLYLSQGRIGQRSLADGCYTWGDTLRMAAAELRQRGEADAARVTLKSGKVTVRQFLLQRFGVRTGRREFWCRPQWTPDRADLHEFLRVLR
ncbi:MAG: hypothetical protein K2X03_21165 [Bryobacteraceae bacterium]|nr:hypothetical protein [Bryobacteraceae bacterium]